MIPKQLFLNKISHTGKNTEKLNPLTKKNMC